MLTDYANEVLEASDRRKVQEHVAECEICRSELNSLQAILEIADDVKIEYPPASVWENFLPDLHRRIANEAALVFRRQQRQRLYLLPGWAAVLAIVLFLSVSLILQDSSSIRPIQIERASNIGIVKSVVPSATKSDSDPMYVAEVISEVLITEAEAEKLRELQNTIQQEISVFPYYLYYDESDILIDTGEDTDTTSDREDVIKYLEDEFTEFDESLITGSDDSVFGEI
jgi:hypothetical protein